MSDAQTLQRQVAQLPASEQIALVEEILNRLDAPNPSFDELWAHEAENRLHAYKAGRVKAIALSEVLAKYKLP